MTRETKIKEDTVTVPVAQGDLDAMSNAEFYNPHGVLGEYLDIGKHADTATIRVLRPLAKSVTVLTQDGEYPMTHEYNGVFVITVSVSGTKKQPTIPDYRVRTEQESGAVLIEGDPYRYMPTVGDMDTYLFGEGRHKKLQEAPGAHVLRYDDPMGGAGGTSGEQVVGTAFSVWAPNIHIVRVVGNFNAWDGRRYAMRELGSSGVWEIFIPGIGAGETYKFQILNANYTWEMKADLMERQHKVLSNTASIIIESTYKWNDDAWIQHHCTTNPHDGPVSIYEVHAGSWRQGLIYRDLAKQLVNYVKQEGFTHVEFMPPAQHPFSGSWGYQVTSYYAVDSRLGSSDDFRYPVDQFHQASIGVIMDWVPAHLPKDAFALGRFDGTPLCEDPDPLRGEHPEWGTYAFNFGRREVRNFLVANALFRLEGLHVDALHVDAVSSMLYPDYSREPGHWHPNIYGGRENLEAIDFLKEVIATAYKNNPGVMVIAEESTTWPDIIAPTSAGGVGFGIKRSMDWMHDALEYLHEEPINRKWHHSEITFSMVCAYPEHYILPISYSEIVCGKGSLYGRMPNDDWQKLAGARSMFTYQRVHPDKKFSFMGNEPVQWGEWDHDTSIDWDCLNWQEHRQVQTTAADLNAFYKAHPASWSQDFDPASFQWLTSDGADHNTLSFLRIGTKGETLAVVVNFSGKAWSDHQMALPTSGKWTEVFTADDVKYGGSDIHNGTFGTAEGEYHSRPFSAKITVPALGIVFLKPED